MTKVLLYTKWDMKTRDTTKEFHDNDKSYDDEEKFGQSSIAISLRLSCHFLEKKKADAKNSLEAEIEQDIEM